MYVFVSEYGYMHVSATQNEHQSPGPGVTGSPESPDVNGGNPTQVLYRNSKFLND